jgi:hypothetical protein
MFTVIPKPDKNWIKNLEKLFYNLIWNDKTEIISRKTMQLPREKGGLKMTNIDCFIKSLKLTWFRRLLCTNSDWIPLFTEITKCNIVHLLNFGPAYSKIKAKNTQNTFWKEALHVFSEFSSMITHSLDHGDIFTEPLWYNDRIKIQNKYIFSKTMYERGFTLVSDLFDSNGNFKRFSDIIEELCIEIPFTYYEGIKRAVLHTWPNVKIVNTKFVIKLYQSKIVKILNLKKRCKRNLQHIFIFTSIS